MGDEVVDHYVHTAKWEQFEFDRRITDLELKRGVRATRAGYCDSNSCVATGRRAASAGLASVAVTATVVNVALPHISEDLGGGLAGLQWTLDAYLVTLTSLLSLGNPVISTIGASSFTTSSSTRRYTVARSPQSGLWPCAVRVACGISWKFRGFLQWSRMTC